MRKLALFTLLSACLAVHYTCCMEPGVLFSDMDLVIKTTDGNNIRFTFADLHCRLTDLCRTSAKELTIVDSRTSERVITLTPEEKIQLKTALLSSHAQWYGAGLRTFVIDVANMQRLPEKVHDAIYGPQKPAHPTLAQRIFNPTTLGFGAMCAIAAYLTAKNTSSPQ